MANPQKEHGFTAIANEIMEHLCKLSLSDYESRVLHVIFRKTYGWDKKADIISLSQFSTMTNIRTQHVARTIKGLLQRNIISVEYLTSQSVEYSFQKNYDLWDKKTLLDTIFESQLLPNEVVPEQVVPEQVVPEQVVPEQVVPNEDTGSTYSGNQVVPKQVDTITILQNNITKTNNKENFCLPNWVNIETWNAYLEMRKKKKAPATEYAKKLIIKELEKLKDQGSDINDVLNQSIKNSWTDVYALKNNNGHGSQIQQEPPTPKYKCVN